MLEAIIFDFNGVITDDEHIHCELFQELIADQGIELSNEEYNERYMAYGDVDFYTRIFADRGRPLSDAQLHELVAEKSRRYHRRFIDDLVVFPGAVELVRLCAAAYPMAIGSGARGDEIEAVLEHLGIRDCFLCIVSADDVSHGKPHPETYETALRQINAWRGGANQPISASNCLVIEDTPGGIAAARAAGMRCLAVTHSAPAERLSEAHSVVPSLEGLDLDALRTVGNDSRR